MRDFVVADSVANGFGRLSTVTFRNKPGFTVMDDTKADGPVRMSSVLGTPKPANTRRRATTPRRRKVFIIVVVRTLNGALAIGSVTFGRDIRALQGTRSTDPRPPCI